MDTPEETVDEQDENKKALNELEAEITEQLYAAIGDSADDPLLKLADIQPPSSIVRAAAVAAAQVFMAFERGYQMTSE